MTIPAWTYSQIEKFETCPRQFYEVKVARNVKEPPTVHTDWGKLVHTAFEEALLNGTPLPEGMTQWQPLANKLIKLPGQKLAEYKFALDRNFQPCDWGDAWTRGIGDLVVLHKDKALVIDYKTGKRKPTEQLDLYANYVFQHFPEVKEVTTGFVWLKIKKIDWEPIPRESAPLIWQGFLPRIARLESAYERDKWPPSPSGLCKGWCPVKSCEFYKDK
jgi:CRISPR/Cas system-associated exonuclease Cas4 (RecB family)